VRLSVVRSHLASMVCAGEIFLNHNNYHRPGPPPVVANAVPIKRRPRRRRKPKVRAPEPFIIGATVTPVTLSYLAPLMLMHLGDPQLHLRSLTHLTLR
jgi:hypothetical protein